ncbi:MAG: hypothetical protein ACRDLB_16925 [Actinomycetota bacterium]
MLVARVAGAATGTVCIVYSAALANHPGSVAFFGGAATVALTIATVTLRPGAIGAAMGLVAVGYGYGLLRADVGFDAGAPLLGVGLLLVGELLELAGAGGDGRVTESAVWRARLVFVLAVAAAGGVAGLAVLLVGGVSRVSGPGLLVLAAVAAVLALLAVIGMVHSLLTGDERDAAPDASGARTTGGR